MLRSITIRNNVGSAAENIGAHFYSCGKSTARQSLTIQLISVFGVFAATKSVRAAFRIETARDFLEKTVKKIEIGY